MAWHIFHMNKLLIDILPIIVPIAEECIFQYVNCSNTPPLGVYDLPADVVHVRIVVVHRCDVSHLAGSQKWEEGVPDAARPDNQDRR